MLADRLAEGHSLRGVVGCDLKGVLRVTYCAGACGRTGAVEALGHYHHALAFLADEHILGYADVVEDEVDGVGGAVAHLVLLLAYAQPRSLCIDIER